MSLIDDKLNLVYDFIDNFIKEKGYSPSVREICSQCSIKSTATAYYYLEKLQESGRITRQSSKNRTVGISDKVVKNVLSIPLIGTVTAGTPILATENFEEYVDIPNDFNVGEEMFMLRAKGTSMIDAGIFDGDKIIVKKQNTANNGDIVVAMFDEGATVKRFFKKDGYFILHPENKLLDDIVLNNVDILGIVVGLIRKF